MEIFHALFCCEIYCCVISMLMNVAFIDAAAERGKLFSEKDFAPAEFVGRKWIIDVQSVDVRGKKRFEATGKIWFLVKIWEIFCFIKLHAKLCYKRILRKEIKHFVEFEIKYVYDHVAQCFKQATLDPSLQNLPNRNIFGQQERKKTNF